MKKKRGESRREQDINSLVFELCPTKKIVRKNVENYYISDQRHQQHHHHHQQHTKTSGFNLSSTVAMTRNIILLFCEAYFTRKSFASETVGTAMTRIPWAEICGISL